MNIFELSAKIALDISDFVSGLNNAGNQFKNFSNGLNNLAKPAVQGFQAVEDVGKKAGDVIKSGLTGFAAAATAVGGFGAAAVKSGMSFDATMSQVAATRRWTVEELNDETSSASKNLQMLRNKALEMGATTKFSASEAADALYYMALAGWETDDMLGGIKGIMDLAAASGEDLAATSDIVTDALTAFGMSAKDSGHFADILAAASSNSNTNVGMMGETFKYAASSAGALGYSAEDTALAIGLMANSGIKASQSGTALRAVFNRLAKPTKESIVAMQELGISLDDGEGGMKSFKQVMDDLRSGFGNLMIPQNEFQDRLSKLNGQLESGEIKQKAYDKELERLVGLAYGAEGAEKAKYAAMLAGQEAMSGLLAIVSAAPEDYEKLTDAIYNCNGAVEEMAATMIDNLQGDLYLFFSALETLQIAISDSLEPTLREFAQFGQKAMANLLEGFQGGGVNGFMDALSRIVTEGLSMLMEKVPEFVAISGKLIAALAEGILNSRSSIMNAANECLVMFGDGLRSWLGSNSESLNAFGNELLRVVFQGFLSAGDIIAESVGQFIPLLANAFLSFHEALFTVGMDILGAIAKGISENKDSIQAMASDTIASMVTSLKENSKDIIEGGFALLEALVGAIMENLPEITDTAVEIITALVEGISHAIPLITECAAQIITQLASGIGEALPELIPTAVEAVLKFIEGLTSPGAIGGLLEGAAKLINGLIEGIVAAVPILIAYAPQIIANLVMALILEIPKLLEVGVNLIMGLGKGLIQGVLALPKFIAEVVTAIIDGFKSLFGIHSPSTIFAEMGTNLIEGLLQGISDTWNRIVEFFSGAVEALTAFFSGAWENIRSGAEAAWNAIGDVLKAAWEAVKSAWEGAVDFFSGLWEGIQNVFSAVSDFFGEVFSAAWEAIQTAWEGVTDFFSGVWEGIQEVFSTAAEVLGGLFSAAWEAIQEAWSGVTDFFSEVWDGIQEVFSTVADVLGGFFSDAWEAIQNVWEGTKEFFSDIADSIHNAFEDVTEAVSGFFEDAWDAVQSVWEDAGDFFGDVWDDISSAFDSTVEWFGSTFSDAWDAVKNAWNDTKTFFGNVVLDILGAFDTTPEEFISIGSDMLKGLWKGISDKIGWLKEKVSGVVETIKGWFVGKDGFDEHSPSKWSNKVFRYVMEGGAAGLYAGMPGLMKGVESVVDRVKNGLEFSPVAAGLSWNGRSAGFPAGQAFPAGIGTTFNVTINSPKAVDAVEAAREWKKTSQRVALGLV